MSVRWRRCEYTQNLLPTYDPESVSDIVKGPVSNKSYSHMG